MRRAALALVLAACSTPDFGNGQLRCAPASPQCPDGYYCASDNHCWQQNSGPNDQGIGSDLLGIDLSMSDIAAADLSMPPDLVPPPDMASTDLQPSTCAGLSVLLCDGFESPTLAANWIQFHAPGVGVYTIEPNPYRGHNSLHIHIDATSTNEPYAQIRSLQGLPQTTTLYARVWAYFPSSFPTNFDQFINFTDSGQGGTAYCIVNNAPTNNDYGSQQFAQSTTATVPRDKWTCLQYEIPQPAAAGTTVTGASRVFVDGAEVSDAAITNAMITQMIRIDFGPDLLNNSMPVGPADVWIDEIILDKNPTTCAE